MGGKVSTLSFFIVSAYSYGSGIIFFSVFLIIDAGLFKTIDPKLYTSIMEADSKGQPAPDIPVGSEMWILALPLLFGVLFILVWRVIAWGALREINGLSRFRSFIAATIFVMLNFPMTALVYLVGIAMKVS